MIRGVLVIAILAATASSAAAQDDLGEPTPSYLIDGGAIPFIWIPALTGIAVDKWMDPRPEPLWFDDDGGLRSDGFETPDWVISGTAVAIGIGIAAGGDESRWFHLKGLAQGLETTALATKLAKNAFGRHRPDFDPENDRADGHRSFFSGHASRSAAALTYLGLYLTDHVIERPRTRVLVWAGLALLEVGISAERVYHHRHHLSDVIAGTVVGAVTATIFYLWQERRYRRARAKVR